ncbi:polysaccharide biosynthesis/export family protein [Mesorhizobium sp. M0166]|uniref:polysaccharide biosynthesis/export family protein n=1 Tax=Mesorhizobium sp. M0166 TaxID=2956902 RepID=UPI003336A96A
MPLLFTLVANAAATEYKLAPGDAIEVTIEGLPEWHHRVPIEFDGTISLPTLGTIEIAGLTAAEMRNKIAAALPTRLFRERTPEGREYSVLVLPTDIAASVAEYRPIYVDGDVLTPGQYAFRPLMAVGQAVALSGGYSTIRGSHATADPNQLVDLREDYNLHALEYVRETVHLSRLQAELNDADSFEENIPATQLIPAANLANVIQSELNLLKTSQESYHQEIASIRAAMKQADGQIAILAQQEEKEQSGAQADAQELEKLTTLFEAGNVQATRVSEARRAVLLSSTRQLQTIVNKMEIQRGREASAQTLNKTANSRRIGLLQDIRETSERLAGAELRLRAASEKLRPGGTTSPSEMLGTAAAPVITITRKVDQDWRLVPADEHTELLPGDIVKVLLPSNQMPGPAAVIGEIDKTPQSRQPAEQSATVQTHQKQDRHTTSAKDASKSEFD